jgi:hypothetical protein
LEPRHFRRKRKQGLEKADIVAFLGEGERLVSAYAMVRPGGERSTVWTPAFGFYLYVRVSGLRGFHPWLESDTGKAKTFKSFDRMLRNLRALRYRGAVTVYDEQDPRRPAAPKGATRRRPGDKKPGQDGHWAVV